MREPCPEPDLEVDVELQEVVLDEGGFLQQAVARRLNGLVPAPQQAADVLVDGEVVADVWFGFDHGVVQGHLVALVRPRRVENLVRNVSR